MRGMDRLTPRQKQILKLMADGWELRATGMGTRHWLCKGLERHPVAYASFTSLRLNKLIERLKSPKYYEWGYVLTEKGRRAIA